MADVAIRVEGLGKQYRIGRRQSGYRTLRETIMEAIHAPFRRGLSLLGGNREGGVKGEESFWALKDACFEIKRGEVVGIIGPNGAGKSTLLKILSRVTEPTEGRAVIHGRLGSLLEVGIGFHPELTGRENIYLNGAIMGLKKSDVERRFDEIVAFSNVDRFIDTPIKHYSSGMYLRLAFAVAAHMETEILLVDEVLAVGDAAFQKKCLDKMGEVAKGGRTVLFVSHNMAAITRLCPETILLQNGMVTAKGPSEEIVNRYLNSCLGNELSPAVLDKTPGERWPFWVTNVSLVDTAGNPIQVVSSGQDIVVKLQYQTASSGQLSNVWARLSFSDASGSPLFVCYSLQSRPERMTIKAQGTLVCRINKLPLVPGSYIMGFAFKGKPADQPEEIVRVYDGVLRLHVTEGDFFGTGKLPSSQHGHFLVDHKWDVME